MTDTSVLYELTAQGRAALMRLDRDAAEACFRQALAEAPHFVDALVGVAQVSYERGDLEVAEQQFSDAYRTALKQAGGRWTGRLRFDDEGERSFLRAIHGLGLILFRRGRGADALKHFQAELRMDPADHQGARFMIRNIQTGQRWDQLAGNRT